MNEAQRKLRQWLEEIQSCIKHIETEMKLKQEALEQHKKDLKEVLDALMTLEGEKG